MEKVQEEQKIETLDNLLGDNAGNIIEEAKPYLVLMMQYRCAIMEVETKLKVLDAEFSQ